MSKRDIALIAAGVIAGAAIVGLWRPSPNTYEECVVYELRGQDVRMVHEIRKLCASRFGKPQGSAS